MAVMTLAQLRLAAQQRADLVNSAFVSDDEWRTYINQGLAELHGLIVQAFGEDYFVRTSTLTYAANATSAMLPSNFFKVRGVDVLVATGTPNQYATLRQYNWNERNAWVSPLGGATLGVVNGWWSNLRYRATQDSLYLMPPPNAAVELLLWHIPVVTELVNDSDSTDQNDSLNGWLEYVIVSAAISVRDKQESSTTVLERQRQRLEARIVSESANRDAGDAETIRDVGASGNGGFERWW